mmetsp:Transcript_99289/g.318538  ORF Transcript_99289/g.318538 Transcript_99289/m.318538 type:complete len:207 (-) Transcript_99289:979-1599(-)
MVTGTSWYLASQEGRCRFCPEACRPSGRGASPAELPGAHPARAARGLGTGSRSLSLGKFQVAWTSACGSRSGQFCPHRTSKADVVRLASPRCRPSQLRSPLGCPSPSQRTVSAVRCCLRERWACCYPSCSTADAATGATWAAACLLGSRPRRSCPRPSHWASCPRTSSRHQDPKTLSPRAPPRPRRTWMAPRRARPQSCPRRRRRR